MATLKSIKNKYLQTSDGTTLGVSDNADNVALLAFKMQASDSIAKFNMVDGFSDSYVDATGVDASGSTNETLTSGYYSGTVVVDASPTGGTTSTYGSTKVNTFLSDADFVVTASGDVDMLIVGGGGGGGDNTGGWHAPGGGGGAGGMRAITGIAVTAQTYAIDVGAGGAGGTGTGGAAVSGSNSVALGYTAAGGGRGSHTWNGGGTSGGSGGGGAGSAGGGGGNSPSTSPSQGNGGGSGSHAGGSGSHDGGGGGGGGAGASGGNYVSDGNQYPIGGAGGSGENNNYRTGSNIVYAGGGGGGGFYTNAGPGGEGGGGSGATDGTANTGGGGGGGGGAPGSDGSDGGSGIVVIKYPDDEFESTAAAALTLVSNSVTAAAQADTADIVATYTNGAGTATLNTDLKYHVSRDNGTTYTEAVMVSQGTSGGHLLVSARGIDISGQPAGTTMRYKITTHNQSASKATRAQAVSLAWA